MASPITRAPPVELAYGEEARASADAPQSRSDKLSEGDLEEDSKPRHECGVFGVYSTSLRNASRVTFFALYALNHRGQESAGIASMDHLGIHVHKGMGLVSQVFTESDIDSLKGNMAIGHTRYSTSGGSKLTGAQPFVLETDLGHFALAHNGQVAKADALRKLVLQRGVGLFSKSDTEVIAQMLAQPHDSRLAARLYEDDRERRGSSVGNLAAMATAAEATAGAPRAGKAAGGGLTTPVLGGLTPLLKGDLGAVPPDLVLGESAAAAPAVLSTRAEAPIWPAVVARIAAFMRACDGAYSFTLLTKDAVYGVRDGLGLRPLCIGQSAAADGSLTYMLSSESCALGTVGAEYVREVLPGEIIRLDADGVSSFLPLREGVGRPVRTPAACIFEYVYFARPDSILEDQQVHNVRTRLGKYLAREHPCPTADIISGVPDSSIAAAIGFAEAAGVPFTEVFCKNRYIGRTFIKPDDTLRKNAIQLKYNALSHVLQGKRVVLVDDSLVRGNTLAQLVPLLRRGGAKEVHVRISSPPLAHPCYMGVDIGTYGELIAHQLGMDTARICATIGADSLGYLSHGGMTAAVREGIPAKRVDHTGVPIGVGHCSACFTGVYPLEHDGGPLEIRGC